MAIRSATIAFLSLILCAGALAAEPTTRPTSPFALRGFKGLWWDGLGNYRKAIPWAARHDMNFVMFCYSSFPASGKDWRGEYTAEEMAGFRELAAEADRLGVELCLSFNPGIWSKPPLTYSDERDYQLAWGKVRAVYGTGIRSFALCLDDINTQLQPGDAERFKDLAHCQVYFANRLWGDLHKLDPRVRLIFCPSAYTTREAEKHEEYTRVIGEGLDPGIDLFWTGPVVCSPSITAADADHMAAAYHRKVIVWDNYPVNDMFPWRPLMAPVKGRGADLAGHVKGLMANPMKQWGASVVPLGTLAEYLRDPAGYEPGRALERVIEGEYAEKDRESVRRLVGVYGSRFLGEAGYPPGPGTDRAHAAEQLTRMRELRAGLEGDADLAELWGDVRATVEADMSVLERMARDRKKESPMKALGDDFDGGAGDRFGYEKYGRAVNYVYAAGTKRDRMGVAFYVPAGDAGKMGVVRVTARNDDSGKACRVRIALNDRVVFEGVSPFGAEGFGTREFEMPAGVLREGANRLVVENLEEKGRLGMPPWFMVAEAELVPRGE